MRRLFTILALAVFGLTILTACNSAEWRNARSTPVAPANAATPADGAARVTVAELKEMLDKNSAVVIDVRNGASYDAGHIRGAKLIPEADILKHLDELPRDKMIVTYCSWPNEHTSARAVVELKNQGVTNAAALLGGYAGWQNAGLPVEAKTPAPTPKP